jgi:hypothetical protein
LRTGLLRHLKIVSGKWLQYRNLRRSRMAQVGTPNVSDAGLGAYRQQVRGSPRSGWPTEAAVRVDLRLIIEGESDSGRSSRALGENNCSRTTAGNQTES